MRRFFVGLCRIRMTPFLIYAIMCIGGAFFYFCLIPTVNTVGIFYTVLANFEGGTQYALYQFPAGWSLDRGADR